MRSRYSMAPGVSILEEKGEKSGLEGEKGGKGNSTRQGEEYTTYTTTDESTVDATCESGRAQKFSRGFI